MDCCQSTVKSFFGGGVAHAYETHQKLLKKYADEYDEDAWKKEDTQFAAEKEKFGEKDAECLRDQRQRQATLDHLAFPLPLWQQLSGLFPNDEKFMHPNERAGRIAALLRNVERMLRREMKPHPRPLPDSQGGENGGAIDDPPGASGEPSTLIRRMYSWDPLRTVCFQLDISAAHLSRYMREATGMSVREIVDCIRVESVRPKMKAALREFVRAWRLNKPTHPSPRVRSAHVGPLPQGESEQPARSLADCATDAGAKDDCATEADEIYAALKKNRRSPRWHRTSWAAELGFSSYSKFFRACLLIYGMTPHEIEIELIDEILAEDDPKRDRQGAPGDDAAGEIVARETAAEKPEVISRE